MPKLRLAKVCDHPPPPRVDHGEHLRSRVHVVSKRRGQVRDITVERRIHTAVIQVVLRQSHRRGPFFALVGQRCQRFHTVGRLIPLRHALFYVCPRLLEVRLVAVDPRLRERQLRFGLLHRACARLQQRARLVHLVDRHELLRQQRFQSLEIVLRIATVSIRAAHRGLGIGHIRLRFRDG